jgi:NADH pyrophosphatase NudC (nudix superfamily)
MKQKIKHTEAQAPPLGGWGVAPSSHFKFCPRCTAPGHFNKERNSFQCPVCGFQFYLNSAAAVTALIFNENEELLIVHRGIEPSKGMLDLPGGFVDAGESVEHALLRELKEELNVFPLSINYFGSFPNQYLFSGFMVSTVDMVFICKVESFTDLKWMDDVSGVQFIKPADINHELVAFDSAKNILTQLINEQHYKTTN